MQQPQVTYQAQQPREVLGYIPHVVINQPLSQPPSMTNTVVVQDQTARVTVANQMWSTSLVDCFQDIPSCCWIASRYNESCCVGCWDLATLTALRTKIRADHKIQGSVCDDCICMCALRHLVLCQMHRELNHKGYV